MRIIILFLALVFSLSAHCQLSKAENKALDQLIASQYELEADALKSTAVRTIFDADFFSIKRTPLYSNDGSFSEAILVKKQDQMQEVSSCEMLLPMVKTDFTLQTKSDAAKLREALNLLLNAMGVNHDEIIQKEKQWIIVTEDWFGEKNGYVIDTETNGKIVAMSYKSGLQL